ncbi:hypothetical protein BHF71_06360 [Vulcanibacillus modesticaldus]|uniref:DUF445 domain-containing protein n=2 Tax=Vulcanibacillus modesticaldus TaxID=337097 RepID=A0A1D2YWE9_9BACI|nr:hypothetical protein BHF71_06360 [Vulcanibacillus modesticaldus]
MAFMKERMDIMYIVFFAIIVGVVIGAFTNSLAIKMLFRPYKPWKIGKWQVPFTPGLIPKRRGELAEQVGYMVEEYLFTPEGTKNFIEKSGVKDQLYNSLMVRLEHLKDEDKTVGDLIALAFGDKWKDSLKSYQKKRLLGFLRSDQLGNKTIEEVLSKKTLNIIDGYLEQLSEHLVIGIKEYLLSEEGLDKIENIIKQMFNGSKMLGFFAGLLVDSNQIQQKIMNFIEETLEKEETKDIIYTFIDKEWKIIRKKQLLEYLDKFEEAFSRQIDYLYESVVDHIDYITVKQLIESLEKRNLIKRGYEFGVSFFIERMDKLFKVLSISNVVKEELENYSLEHLEKLIIEVSGKELKMITYLGGVIGGILGLIQGILYLVY